MNKSVAAKNFGTYKDKKVKFHMSFVIYIEHELKSLL